jgi:hypothetical protein
MVMYFFVSGRAKVETGIDDSTKSIADNCRFNGS